MSSRQTNLDVECSRVRFVVTAGPTREHLDPVRFLSNPSTGKMGFAVARAACRRGCETVLVAGPVCLRTPAHVRRLDVVSARDMLAAVKAVLAEPWSGTTVLVATAAVADWRPAVCAKQKLKKSQMSDTLKLVRNPDILKTVSAACRKTGLSRTILVGFAAETRNLLDEAVRKCREKGLALIVANDVTQTGCGFGVDTNRVTLLRPDGGVQALPLMTKTAVARRIVAEALSLIPTSFHPTQQEKT